MNNTVTPERVREWRAMAKAATPGEWVEPVVGLADDADGKRPHADAALIAAAREAVPALCDALEEARKERDALAAEAGRRDLSDAPRLVQALATIGAILPEPERVSLDEALRRPDGGAMTPRTTVACVSCDWRGRRVRGECACDGEDALYCSCAWRRCPRCSARVVPARWARDARRDLVLWRRMEER